MELLFQFLLVAFTQQNVHTREEVVKCDNGGMYSYIHI